MVQYKPLLRPELKCGWCLDVRTSIEVRCKLMAAVNRSAVQATASLEQGLRALRYQHQTRMWTY